jgi:hypothetical protein
LFLVDDIVIADDICAVWLFTDEIVHVSIPFGWFMWIGLIIEWNFLVVKLVG